MKSFFSFFFFFFFFFSQSQIGIGTTNPDSSSILDLQSSSKGLLIPRVSLQSVNDVFTISSPATSLLVYNITSNNEVFPGFYYWDSIWKPLKTTLSSSAGPNWSLGGNIISGTDFFGSVNYSPLQFKVNNNYFGKFHPNGGIALGYGAVANDNNAIAIGTNANASFSNQALAIGPSSKASGYQSTAFGFGAVSTNNSASAFGYQATASGYQSTSVGMGSSALGQNATAIGYQATASQDNSIILGSSSNPNNKVGLGTNTPDERLHIVGSLKIVDGTQSSGYVLVSDANGKSKWQSPSFNKYYGNIYYNGSGQVLNQFSNIVFGTSNISKDVTLDTDGITVTTAGIYRISYTVSLSKNGGASISPIFSLYKDFNTLIDGSKSTITITNNQSQTITNTVIVSLNAYQKVSVRSNLSDSFTSITSNGTSLTIENIQ